MRLWLLFRRRAGGTARGPSREGGAAGRLQGAGGARPPRVRLFAPAGRRRVLRAPAGDGAGLEYSHGLHGCVVECRLKSVVWSAGAAASPCAQQLLQQPSPAGGALGARAGRAPGPARCRSRPGARRSATCPQLRLRPHLVQRSSRSLGDRLPRVHIPAPARPSGLRHPLFLFLIYSYSYFSRPAPTAQAPRSRRCRRCRCRPPSA